MNVKSKSYISLLFNSHHQDISPAPRAASRQPPVLRRAVMGSSEIFCRDNPTIRHGAALNTRAATNLRVFHNHGEGPY